MDTPDTLGDAGARLWHAVITSLPDGWELAPHELAVLELAARQADDLAALEASLAEHGSMVTGSRGQPVINAAVQEARQARQSIARLVKQLGIPDEAAAPPMSASDKARHAANARWGRRPAARKAADA